MSNYATEGTFASKKAFAEHVAAKGADKVFVKDTSFFNNKGRVSVASLADTSAMIIGPNAFNDRRWYANVKTNKRAGTVGIK